MGAIRVNAMSYAKLCKALQPGLFTIQQLAEESGLGEGAVYTSTKALHKEGLIHICEWERDVRGAPTLRVYKWGPGKDAKRKVLTDAERTARWRAKQKRLMENQLMAGKARAFKTANNKLSFELI